MKITFLLLMAIVLIALLLVGGQRRMIYYPRSYGEDLQLPANCRVIEFSTSQGRQQAFYLWSPEEGDKVPTRLWLLAGGNAALALDWLEMLEGFPDPGAGFLLLDYPGYGRSEGRVGPEAIFESIEAALAALATGFAVEPRELAGRLQVMGHSLGAAAVLLYAGQQRVQRIVLVSPFTSLKDMAALLVGSLLSRSLFHDYDNLARLGEIVARDPEVPITIIHGDHDKIIPVRMGRELAALSPGIKYREIPNGDHNYILITARDEILAAMTGAEIAVKPVGE